MRHAARAAVLVVAAATLLVLAAAAALAGPADGSHAAAEEAFVEKINAERAAEGLDGLAVDVQLTRVARGWTGQMHRTDELRHNPDYANQIDGPWQRLGENVGYTIRTGASEETLVSRLHTAFMDSPGHRRNVLGDWTHVGVGVSVTDRNKMWVTVNFMRSPDSTESARVRDAVTTSRGLFATHGEGGSLTPAADGSEPAEHVVVGRADLFADSLAGSGLAGGDGPVLLTDGPRGHDGQPVLHPAVRTEIDRVLGGSGTVYLLGGEAAVSPRVADELAAGGYTVERLSGEDRIATAVAVAEEVAARNGGPDEVLLATSRDWADAVAGGAYAARSGTVVLLTDRDRLDARVARFLADYAPGQVWALGGTAALAERVVAAADAERAWGADRAATSVAIAEQVWQRNGEGSGGDFLLVEGHADRGWSDALTHAPHAAVDDAPQLLVSDPVPASVQGYLEHVGPSLALRGTGGVTAGTLDSLVDATR